MAKKDDMLRGGLSNLLGGGPRIKNTTAAEPEAKPIPNRGADERDAVSESIQEPAKRGRKKKEPEESPKYGRLCAVVNTAKMDKMRAIADMEGLQIKDVLEAAMDLAIQRYEKKHGEIESNYKKEKKTAKGLFS